MVNHMMQCPLCGDVPATCLTQEGINPNPQHNAILVSMGYWLYTVHHSLVKPIMIPDSIVAPEAPVAEAA